ARTRILVQADPTPLLHSPRIPPATGRLITRPDARSALEPMPGTSAVAGIGLDGHSGRRKTAAALGNLPPTRPPQLSWLV
ncbi:hypothetical protein, partial [Promicromonospora panici]|uniref:hypothetical protein n=1 Tax=Promicromonospora panici TaxID=2219658 RepID=UPI001A929F40